MMAKHCFTANQKRVQTCLSNACSQPEHNTKQWERWHPINFWRSVMSAWYSLYSVTQALACGWKTRFCDGMLWSLNCLLSKLDHMLSCNRNQMERQGKEIVLFHVGCLAGSVSIIHLTICDPHWSVRWTELLSTFQRTFLVYSLRKYRWTNSYMQVERF